MRSISLFFVLFFVFAVAHGEPREALFWMKIKANNKVERSLVVDAGASIEMVADDYVIAIGSEKQRKIYQSMGRLESSYAIESNRDFPSEDSDFHNYGEERSSLMNLVARFPKITALDSIGKSAEGRDILRLRISGNLGQADTLPGVVYLGGHHAREHLSIEVPLLFAKHLLENYETDPTIHRLIDSRDIHIVPMVNPDGAEFDIGTGDYKFWRKNRRPTGGRYTGVDLNRNYGFGWGGGGASTDPSSDIFRGPSAFSEPETQAVKAMIDRQSNVTMLLSFHTFSELILYPWGHSYDPVPQANDRSVFERMAKTMSGWNGYTPQQASDLYIASGDTCDWAYGAHKIFAFTFELDPANVFGGNGGFYPGQAVIPVVLNKNLKPALYMLEYADNPYRVNSPSLDYGLTSPLLR